MAWKFLVIITWPAKYEAMEEAESSSIWLLYAVLYTKTQIHLKK